MRHARFRTGWVLGLIFIAGCAQNHDVFSLTFSGTLEMTEYSVGSPVPGRLARVFVDEEDDVRKGQIIAQLEHFEQAQKDYQRAEALVKSGGVSRQEYEHTKQAMDDQQAVSPVDGVVLVKVREPGEVVGAGAPIVVVGEQADTWIKVFIPEDLVSRLAAGQKARIFVDGLSRELAGHIISIATKAEFTPRNIQTPEERATQTFAVKVKVDDSTTPLRPGVTADVHFLREKVHAD